MDLLDMLDNFFEKNRKIIFAIFVFLMVAELVMWLLSYTIPLAIVYLLYTIL